MLSWLFGSSAATEHDKTTKRDKTIEEYADKITLARAALATAASAWKKARDEAGIADDAGDSTQAESILSAAQGHQAKMKAEEKMLEILMTTYGQLLQQRADAVLSNAVADAKRAIQEGSAVASQNTQVQIDELGSTLQASQDQQERLA